MPEFKTFGSYTYTDAEVMAGKLDLIVRELRQSGWATYGITSRHNSWNGRTTFFLHCNTVG